MTYPASDVVTTNLDAGTDSPATARSDLLDLATKFNQLRNHITSFMQTFLSRSTAALARADLGVAPRATRIDVASVAGTADLTTNAPDSDDIQITGALAITAFTVAVGRVIRVRASGAHTLANNGSIVTQTGTTIICAAGDTYVLRATAANVVEVLFHSVNGAWPYAFRIGNSGSATSLSGLTKIPFVGSAGGNSEITVSSGNIIVGRKGVYELKLKQEYVAGAAGGSFAVEVYRNGTSFEAFQLLTCAASATTYLRESCYLVALAASDYFEVFVYNYANSTQGTGKNYQSDVRLVK